MAFICEFIPGDKSIQLGAEQIVRALPFGPVWNKIRIGVQYHWNCAVLPYALTLPGFYVGACTNGLAYYNDNCLSAIFISNSIANSATYTAGAAPYIGTNSSYGLSGYQKAGTTITTLLSSTSYSSHRASCSPAFRTAGFYDIAKTATGATIQGWAQTNSTDQTAALFRAALENESSPASMTGSAAVGSNLTVTTDWNSIFIAWTRCEHTLNICGLSIARFA